MIDRPNPLIPGFNPDPSVVLVDGAYWLVTSSSVMSVYPSP